MPVVNHCAPAFIVFTEDTEIRIHRQNTEVCRRGSALRQRGEQKTLNVSVFRIELWSPWKKMGRVPGDFFERYLGGRLAYIRGVLAFASRLPEVMVVVAGHVDDGAIHR